MGVGGPSEFRILDILGYAHLLRYLVAAASSRLFIQDKGNLWMVRSPV